MISPTFRDMLSRKSVIRELSEEATRLAADGRGEVFDFSLGSPSVPPPPELKSVLQSLPDEIPESLLHGYSPTLGIPEVKQAIADSLNRRFHMDYSAADIFPTSGAAAALAHAFRLVTVPGDEIVTFAPYFPEYGPYVAPTGCRLTVVEADPVSYEINFEALEKAMNPRVMALLINTPNNPSGVMYREETLQNLASFLERKERELGHELWLISDEPYREITFDGRQCPYVSRFWPRTLSCYSFSKSLSIPGERIGYLAVNPACGQSAMLVQMCGQISRGIGHNCPTSMMQHLIARLIDRTSDLSVYETNMNLIYTALRDCGVQVTRPGGTFYIMPKLPGPDANAACRRALEYRLVMVPCDTFGLPGHLRIAFCQSTGKVQRSLDALRAFFTREQDLNS
jgi:aspartate aminotransferase